MSSEADVKRLVDAARKMNELLGRGAVPTNEWNAAYDWFRSALAPFAAERDAPAPVDLPPDGTRWIDERQGNGYEVQNGVLMLIGNAQYVAMGPPTPSGNFTTARSVMDAIASGCLKPAPPSPSPSVPTPEQVAERMRVVWNDIPKWDDTVKEWAAIITADRAAVTAPLRAEVERLEQLRKDYAAVNEDQRAAIVSLEAKLDTPVCRLQFPDGSVPGNTAEAADGWYRVAQEYRAKLAAGGGVDPAMLETATRLATGMMGCPHLRLQSGKSATVLEVVQEAVDGARALHAALAAKGAERG